MCRQVVLAGIPVSDEGTPLCDQVLLGNFEALTERSRCRLVQQSPGSGTRSVGRFDSIQAWPDFSAALGDCPHLARRERIEAD